MFTSEIKKKCDLLPNKIIGCAIEVHKLLGPGLLESAYESCLCYELSKNDIRFQKQVELPVIYKESRIDVGYRIDVLVEDFIILELKAIDVVLPVHKAQLKTYLKLSEKWLGLLMNFNVELMKNGIERIVYG
ncbi:MAG: GxxExxY protein [Ignavibacteria bacterium]